MTSSRRIWERERGRARATEKGRGIHSSPLQWELNRSRPDSWEKLVGGQSLCVLSLWKVNHPELPGFRLFELSEWATIAGRPGELRVTKSFSSAKRILNVYVGPHPAPHDYIHLPSPTHQSIAAPPLLFLRDLWNDGPVPAGGWKGLLNGSWMAVIVVLEGVCAPLAEGSARQWAQSGSSLKLSLINDFSKPHLSPQHKDTLFTLLFYFLQLTNTSLSFFSFFLSCLLSYILTCSHFHSFFDCPTVLSTLSFSVSLFLPV